MAKTLLAVDDSVTMRKVLEITFSGEDFRVISAEGSHAALGKMAESPQVAVIDTVLAGEDGYALAKEVRRKSPGTAILLLASRYAPYDQARGKDAGADDWADKPFDTQQLIDKVRKIMVAKEASGSIAAPAPTPAPAPAAVTPNPPPARPAPAPAATPQPLGRGTQPSLSNQVPSAVRTGTLVFGENAPVIPPARPAPLPVPAAAPPPPPPPPPAFAAPMTPAPAPVAAAINGHMAAKLGGLGLSPEQADAVLALSREVVERVVWEVVPQLAEALIKEEIARLTKD